MRVETLVEHELTAEHHAEITELRNSCFPDCQHPRSYFKQLPHLRILAREGSSVVGHLGVDHRMIRFGEEVARIFGVVDLCVEKKRRGKGIAGRMLGELESLARAAEADALLLVADDRRIYQRSGFKTFDADCQWLRIDEHLNYGVANERLADELMIKRLDTSLVLEGPVDLLGYLY